MFTITDEDRQLREEVLAHKGEPLESSEQVRTAQEAILEGSFEKILLEKAAELQRMFRDGEPHSAERPLAIRVLVSQEAIVKAMPRGTMTNDNVRLLIHRHVSRRDFAIAYLHVDYYGDGHSQTLDGERYTEFFLKLAA